MDLGYLEITSIFVCVLLVVGYLNRRQKKIHIPMMVSAFVIDMTIVLIIEFSRGAIDAAKSKMGPLMIVHICISVTVILLYITQIVSGIKKARGKPCGWHGHTGLMLLITRLGNLVTSFMVMQINP